MKYALRAVPLLLMVAAATTCRPPPRRFAWPVVRGPVGVTIDPAFSDDEREDILVAISAWNHADQTCATFVPQPGGGIRVLRASSWSDLPPFDGLGENTVGVWTGATRTIWLVPSALRGARIAFRSVVAHELGHMIGLTHTTSGLMAPWAREDALEHGAIPADVVARTRAMCLGDTP